ncbi:hypothetical protein K470DRAFT_196580, partial [Piedraia hortae CBS 480.64]
PPPPPLPKTPFPEMSARPKKKPRTHLSDQATQLEALFANPDQDLSLPDKSQPQVRPPPEIVTNARGSSAGAGSGEFHVYKASRRREFERLKVMEEE